MGTLKTKYLGHTDTQNSKSSSEKTHLWKRRPQQGDKHNYTETKKDAENKKQQLLANLFAVSEDNSRTQKTLSRASPPPLSFQCVCVCVWDSAIRKGITMNDKQQQTTTGTQGFGFGGGIHAVPMFSMHRSLGANPWKAIVCSHDTRGYLRPSLYVDCLRLVPHKNRKPVFEEVVSCLPTYPGIGERVNQKKCYRDSALSVHVRPLVIQRDFLKCKKQGH